VYSPVKKSAGVLFKERLLLAVCSVRGCSTSVLGSFVPAEVDQAEHAKLKKLKKQVCFCYTT
jgi:hypothetical protein